MIATNKLPSLEFKYHKESSKPVSNTNTNTNTINNNIIINDNKDKEKEKVTKGDSTPSGSESQTISKDNSTRSLALSRSETPSNIKQFKEAMLEILIGYFKNNIVLINNLVELSEYIVMRVDDLIHLISLLLITDKSNIEIVAGEVESKCCGKVCSHLPRYRKVEDIIIGKKQSFKVYFNQYYIQMQTEFNISLDYVML
jgi:hypothetical protein